MESRPRKHRLTVGDATFIVTSNVDGNKRWIREVHHVRRHRSGMSANVCIYPNGGRKPSATLSSLWAHLGIDPAARWMECAADHPAFPARRNIKTALDQADDDRKARAAAAVLLAAGWTWTEGENERWIAPPAQGIDLSPIATRKLGELAAQGYVTNGVAIFNPATGQRGLVDNLGFVGWMGGKRDAGAGVKP